MDATLLGARLHHARDLGARARPDADFFRGLFLPLRVSGDLRGAVRIGRGRSGFLCGRGPAREYICEAGRLRIGQRGLRDRFVMVSGDAARRTRTGHAARGLYGERHPVPPLWNRGFERRRRGHSARRSRVLLRSRRGRHRMSGPDSVSERIWRSQHRSRRRSVLRHRRCHVVPASRAGPAARRGGSDVPAACGAHGHQREIPCVGCARSQGAEAAAGDFRGLEQFLARGSDHRPRLSQHRNRCGCGYRARRQGLGSPDSRGAPHAQPRRSGRGILPASWRQNPGDRLRRRL